MDKPARVHDPALLMDPLREMVVDDNPTVVRAATRIPDDSEGITIIGALLEGADVLRLKNPAGFTRRTAR